MFFFCQRLGLSCIVFAMLTACKNSSDQTPISCTAASIGTNGYSLVFKGCSTANLPEYYDKTECVRDNTTGLIWQGQTSEGSGLRANDQFKTNFDSTTALQIYSHHLPSDGIKDAVFFYIAPTQAQIDATSNSIGFKNAVNASKLCNVSTWRLPTNNELLGLIRLTENSIVDKSWFPNMPPKGKYWTSSVNVGEHPRYALQVDFDEHREYNGHIADKDDGRDYSRTRAIWVDNDILVRLVHE